MDNKIALVTVHYNFIFIFIFYIYLYFSFVRLVLLLPECMVVLDFFFQMESWQPAQPASLVKPLNVEVILISEFVISEESILQKNVEVVLISEFMKPEIRIISTFRLFSPAGKLAG